MPRRTKGLSKSRSTADSQAKQLDGSADTASPLRPIGSSPPTLPHASGGAPSRSAGAANTAAQSLVGTAQVLAAVGGGPPVETAGCVASAAQGGRASGQDEDDQSKEMSAERSAASDLDDDPDFVPMQPYARAVLASPLVVAVLRFLEAEAAARAQRVSLAWQAAGKDEWLWRRLSRMACRVNDDRKSKRASTVYGGAYRLDGDLVRVLVRMRRGLWARWRLHILPQDHSDMTTPFALTDSDKYRDSAGNFALPPNMRLQVESLHVMSPPRQLDPVQRPELLDHEMEAEGRMAEEEPELLKAKAKAKAKAGTESGSVVRSGTVSSASPAAAGGGATASAPKCVEEEAGGGATASAPKCVEEEAGGGAPTATGSGEGSESGAEATGNAATAGSGSGTQPIPKELPGDISQPEHLDDQHRGRNGNGNRAGPVEVHEDGVDGDDDATGEMPESPSLRSAAEVHATIQSLDLAGPVRATDDYATASAKMAAAAAVSGSSQAQAQEAAREWARATAGTAAYRGEPEAVPGTGTLAEGGEMHGSSSESAGGVPTRMRAVKGSIGVGSGRNPGVAGAGLSRHSDGGSNSGRDAGRRLGSSKRDRAQARAAGKTERAKKQKERTADDAAAWSWERTRVRVPIDSILWWRGDDEEMRSLVAANRWDPEDVLGTREIEVDGEIFDFVNEEGRVLGLF